MFVNFDQCLRFSQFKSYSLLLQRTYGQWWDKAPSRLTDYMPQNNVDVVSQDYIGTYYLMSNVNILY